MIYLFCNEAYGKLIREAGVEYATAHSTPITVVMSARKRNNRGWVGRVFAFLSDASDLLSKFSRERSLTERYGTKVILTRNVNAWWFVRRIKPEDHGIVSGFNQIFHAVTIGRFQTLVNFHPSILPFYRGPVPSYWVLQNGEQTSGYTVHHITPRIDDGEILYQEEVPVGGVVAPADLNERIAARCAKLLPRYLDHLASGSEWCKVEINAAAIYKTRVDYLSYPEREQARNRS